MDKSNDKILLEQELESLRKENTRLRINLDELRSRLTEPAEVIRAIQQGEIDALVVQEDGQEEIYSLQRIDSVYRTVVEQCFPFGVWLSQLDGWLLYVTPSFLNVLETSLEEMREKGQFHFLPQPVREQVEREWNRCRQTGDRLNVEYTVRLSDGSEITVWTQGLIVQAPDGRPRWVGVNIDVTRQKEIQETLKESDRRKDEFLATLAHELRNPLAPICSGLELMRIAANNPTIMEETRSTMDGQVRQLVRLVDDLLDLSRITSGKVTLRKESVDLALIVRTAFDAVRPLIEEKRHHLTIDLPDKPVQLMVDPIRLSQILSNLLTNAAKYTEPGGQIKLSAHQQGKEILLKVQDTGIGIPQEMQARIFDMFIQVDHSLERSQNGLGIGLTLVKRLVEMHGGTVGVESAGAGQGSEFHIWLPMLIGTAQEPLAPVHPLATASGSFRILVVDDNQDAADMLGALLRMAGHEICIAYNGREAIEIASGYHPDVILMDVGMPYLNGYDAVRQIRKEAWGKTVIIVALTGWGQAGDKQQARDAGFNYHFVKPVDPAALRQLLSDLGSKSISKTGSL